MKKCRHNIEDSLIVSERIPNLPEDNDHDEDQADDEDGGQDPDVGPLVEYCGNTKGIDLINISQNITGKLYFSPPPRVF